MTKVKGPAHWCAGHFAKGEKPQRASRAVVIQMGTVGEKPRRRAKSITLYICSGCSRKLFTGRERGLHKVIGEALARMVRALRSEAVPS